MKGAIMKTNKWFWGVFFICAAAAVILNALGYLASVSLFSIIFTIVLIPILVESALHRHFAGIFFPLAIMGILFSKPLHIEPLSPWPLLAAALFLSIAFSIMFRRKRFYEFFKQHKKYHDYPGGFDENIEYVSDDEADCDASFSSCTKYIHCAALKKANLRCSFGALKVFFDNTQLDPGGATVNVDGSVGSIEMFIPKTWHVRSTVVASLGAVEERNKPTGDASGPLMVINGRVSIGSLVIIYV
jgi:predicted membrane protein